MREATPPRQYDDVTLSEETESGKSPTYAMEIARHPSIWFDLNNELEAWFRDHSKDTGGSESARITIIIKFCQIAFAHGKDIQDLALSSRIHQQIVRSIPFAPRLAYNALSNLITKNPHAIVVLEDSLIKRTLSPLSFVDVPCAALLFLRNSLALSKEADHVDRWY